MFKSILKFFFGEKKAQPEVAPEVAVATVSLQDPMTGIVYTPEVAPALAPVVEEKKEAIQTLADVIKQTAEKEQPKQAPAKKPAAKKEAPKQPAKKPTSKRKPGTARKK